MAFFTGEKKMVAPPHYSCTPAFQHPDRFLRLRDCTFYLHALLKEQETMETPKSDNNLKALQTMSVFAFVCIILHVVTKHPLPLYLALAFLCIGLFVRKLSVFISAGWMKFAMVFGTINTKIILTVIFFLIVTPLALIYRVFHGDFMMLKKDTRRESCYNFRNHSYSAQDLENYW